MIPIYIYTNHGVFELQGKEEDTIGKTLKDAGIPLSAVSTYQTKKPKPTSSISSSDLHFIGSNTRLKDIIKQKKGIQVVAQLSRNIALSSFLTENNPTFRKIDNPTAEWIFPDKDKGAFQKNLVQVSSQECLNFVVESVKEVLKKWPEKSKPKMVVGVSGGGDSNVLLTALIKSGLINLKDIYPVMMLGIPDQEKVKNQAEKMCSDLNLKIEFIESNQVARIIGVSSFSKLREEFVKNYPNTDLEFLGTFLIRHTLSYYAKLRKTKYVALGLNREDLLSSALIRVARGRKPLPMPFRKIGPITFVYPIWKVPKKIGDGAYPHFSLVNYESRDPSYSEGRCLYYYISYMLSEIAPGLDISLLEGFSRLASKDDESITLEKELNDFLCKDDFTPVQLKKWKNFLNKVKRKT